MEERDAIIALGALAQQHRLRIFRHLLRIGPSGRPAGEIAAALGLSPSGLSFHLGHLQRAGLLRSWRRRRNVFYAADIDRMRRLLGFLTEDCCGGHPEICGDLALIAALRGVPDPGDRRRDPVPGGEPEPGPDGMTRDFEQPTSQDI